MSEERKKMSALCVALLIWNFIGIWGLMVFPYLMGILGIDLPIEAPLHLIDVTLALVAMACGVGLRSFFEVVKAYFSRGTGNVG